MQKQRIEWTDCMYGGDGDGVAGGNNGDDITMMNYNKIEA